MKVPHSVYVLDCDQGVKVGITCDLDSRCAGLKRAFGMPVVVLRSWEFPSRDDAWHVEQNTHWLLREMRTAGEWFHCHPLEAVAAVERARRSGRLRYIVERDLTPEQLRWPSAGERAA